MNYIKGLFKKIIFKSDNGYIIGLFRVKDSDLEEYINKTITITGYFHELSIDDSYIMNGEMVKNPKYGMQFNVKSYERTIPKGEEAIIEFLSGGLFKGEGSRGSGLRRAGHRHPDARAQADCEHHCRDSGPTH